MMNELMRDWKTKDERIIQSDSDGFGRIECSTSFREVVDSDYRIGIPELNRCLDVVSCERLQLQLQYL
jgi:hypothetical protein